MTRTRDDFALALDGPSLGLAGLAHRLGAAAPVVSPDPDFRAALRKRLIAVAEVQQVSTPVERPVTVPWRASRRLGVAAGAMASVVVVSGVAVAGAHSLPGQPFYGVKTAGEAVSLDLTHGDAAKGAKQLDHARTRLREVNALAAGDGQLSLGSPSGGHLAGGLAIGGSRSANLRRTLAAMDSQTRKGGALLLTAYREHGDTAALQLLARFTSSQQSGLTAVRGSLPADVQAQAGDSLGLVNSLGATAKVLLALAPASTPLVAPGPSPSAAPVPSSGPQPSSTQTPRPSVTSPAPDPTSDPTSDPTPAASATTDPTPDPTASPTPSPTSGPTPTPTPAPSPTPTPAPVPTLPVPLPTSLPTALPTIPPLPTALPTILPSGLPTLLP